MRIEFLWFNECPNHESARQMLREVLDEAGLPVVFDDIDASDPEVAQQLRFAGSPSIRVDGLDIEPAFQEPDAFAPSRRVYYTSAGLTGLPETDWIRAALARALRDEGGH